MKPKRLLLTFFLVLIIAIGCSYVSNGGQSINDWPVFLIAAMLGCGFLWAGWRSLRTESLPNWLLWLLIAAVLLRLGAAVFWWVALPQWGYGNEGEVAGYIMADAFERDQAAWELSQSDQPLTSAFSEFRLADQYGGFLFASAGLYRFLKPDLHNPLLVILITASISSLAIIFSWAFANRLWGRAVAKFGAILLAVYPEAILLGSSQMREALMITILAAAVWSLAAYRQEQKWGFLVGVIGLVLITIPLSSIFSILLVVILVSLAALLDRGQIFQKWQLWVALILLGIIGIFGLGFVGDQVLPAGAANPLEALQEWLKYAAKWEARNATLLSGWMDKIFQGSPKWMHTWIILGYGTVQPFLPAALIASGNLNLLWHLIAIWRAVGWTFLLFLLIYAPLRALRSFKKNYLAAGISLLVWLGIFLAAYRGGGDQWDNPRYRLTLVPLQVSVAGWVWFKQRNNPDPWLRRILGGLIFVLIWFVPWYLRRYMPVFTWPLVDLFKTLGVGLISMLLFWIWDWARKN
jgi:hypothetical protein